LLKIVDDLSTHEDKDKIILQDEAPKLGDSPLAQLDKAEAPKSGSLRESWQTEKPVVCVPGLGLLDEAAAMMIAQLLERQGIGARVEQADALSMSRISSWDIKGIALVCLCYVENASPAQIRYAIRRIRRRTSETTTLVALLGDSEEITGQVLSENTELVQHSLRATVDKIIATASDSSGRADSQIENRATA